MATLAFLNQVGPGELILIALVALLLFGGRLPEVGRNLGRGISQFKKGLKEAENGIKKDLDDEDKKKD